jgi:hypothetical protein
VWKQNLKAFVLAKEVWLQRQGFRPDRDYKRFGRFQRQPEAERLRPASKSRLDYTANNN